jgi:hypothetical protein
MNEREISQLVSSAERLAQSAYNVQQPGEASRKLIEAVLQLTAAVKELAKVQASAGKNE